jgi:hypothetical protein
MRTLLFKDRPNFLPVDRFSWASAGPVEPGFELNHFDAVAALNGLSTLQSGLREVLLFPGEPERSKRRLDFGRADSGACEARLFQFTGQAHGEGDLRLPDQLNGF